LRCATNGKAGVAVGAGVAVVAVQTIAPVTFAVLFVSVTVNAAVVGVFGSNVSVAGETTGVGTGVGVGDAVALGTGVGDGMHVGAAVAVAVDVGDAVGAPVGDTVGEPDGDVVGPALAVGDALGLGAGEPPIL
jgi:hypothetical protein